MKKLTQSQPTLLKITLKSGNSRRKSLFYSTSATISTQIPKLSLVQKTKSLEKAHYAMLRSGWRLAMPSCSDSVIKSCRSTSLTKHKLYWAANRNWWHTSTSKARRASILWQQPSILEMLKWQRGSTTINFRLKYTKEILTHMLNGTSPPNNGAIGGNTPDDNNPTGMTSNPGSSQQQIGKTGSSWNLNRWYRKNPIYL